MSLHSRARKKKPIPSSVRRDVARANGGEPGTTVPTRCHYCKAVGNIHWPMNHNGTPAAWPVFNGLELDHSIPEFHGGLSVAENIVLACQPCNRRKGYSL